MKYILYKRQFESLGVSKGLEGIVDLVLKNLGENRPEYKLNTNLRDQEVEIQFVYNQDREEYKGSSLHSYMQLLDADPDNLKFLISLGDLKPSTITHELKHVDRELSRGLIANFSYYLNHVGRDVVENMEHLVKDIESKDILSLSLYLINKDEFEAYFNEFYKELKGMLNEDMSQKQKESVIKNYLEDQDIYNLYKDIKKQGGFKLESYFKNKDSMVKYLSAFNSKMQEFIEDEEAEYENWEKLKTEEDTTSGMNKLAKKIDHMLTRIVNEGVKKFDRLYSIL